MEDSLIVKCPDCGQLIEYEITPVLLATENKFAKRMLKNDELFAFSCEACGKKVDLFYDMIYHDPEKLLTIYLVNEENFRGVVTQIELERSLKFEMAMSQGMSDDEFGDDNYPTIRVLCDPYLLREKVVIFDLGFDDRIVEILKLICINELSETEPDFQAHKAYFYMNGNEQVIDVVDAEGNIMTMHIEGNAYSEVYDKFFDYVAEDDCVAIDAQWAMQFFEDLSKNPDEEDDPPIFEVRDDDE